MFQVLFVLAWFSALFGYMAWDWSHRDRWFRNDQ